MADRRRHPGWAVVDPGRAAGRLRGQPDDHRDSGRLDPAIDSRPSPTLTPATPTPRRPSTPDLPAATPGPSEPPARLARRSAHRSSATACGSRCELGRRTRCEPGQRTVIDGDDQEHRARTRCTGRVDGCGVDVCTAAGLTGRSWRPSARSRSTPPAAGYSDWLQAEARRRRSRSRLEFEPDRLVGHDGRLRMRRSRRSDRQPQAGRSPRPANCSGTARRMFRLGPPPSSSGRHHGDVRSTGIAEHATKAADRRDKPIVGHAR